MRDADPIARHQALHTAAYDQRSRTESSNRCGSRSKDLLSKLVGLQSGPRHDAAHTAAASGPRAARRGVGDPAPADELARAAHQGRARRAVRGGL